MIEFDWLIHYRCSYRCSYCFFEGMWEEVGKRNKHIPVEQWSAAWKRIHERYGRIRITITGGEPFLYPGFLQLLHSIKELAHVSFDTNLSCSKESIRELTKVMDPGTLFMGLSYHPQFSEIHEFIEKAQLLKDSGFQFRVHFVTYPPHLKMLKELKDTFTARGYRFVPIPFRGKYQGKEYPSAFSEEERSSIYEVNEGIAAIDKAWSDNQVVQVKSKDKICSAGQSYARVDADGSVYPCGNDYAKSGGKHYLGNIMDVNFKLREEPFVCAQETCPCEFRWIKKES